MRMDGTPISAEERAATNIGKLQARIAELEAENAQIRLHWQREARNASRTDAALEQAEAEVRTVKAHLSQRDVLLQEAEAELAVWEDDNEDYADLLRKYEQAEAALAKMTQRNDELRSTLKAYLATIKRLEAKVADREASKVEAESHAADCKRLVTACEDDIDMLRLRCREHEARYSDVVAEHENELALRLEAEAEVARLRKLFGMAERGAKP